ncbi:MAG: 30S ribosomal protein S21 [Lactobacillales bacterium]|nr:30S ribosomal protein S21 [Lactobacillales bacterium]
MLYIVKNSVIITLVLREGGIKLTKVVVKNGNVDSALRMLKQKNVKDGLSKKVRERQEGYLKPGVKRRLEKKENIKNSRRRNKERY